MLDPITFDVLGVPVPQGSKTAFVVKGRAVLTDGRRPASRRAHADWRRAVAEAATRVQERQPMAPLDGPVSLTLEFRFLRPKSARRKTWCDVRPDADKLARSALDSLQGILLADDSRVAELVVRKRYASDEAAGCRVTIAALEGAS